MKKYENHLGNNYFSYLVVAAVILSAVLTSCFQNKSDDKQPNSVYTVRFISNGGSEVALQAAIDGEKVTRPDDPIRDGYDFTGWYKERWFANKWNFNADKVTSDTTLYAGWEQKQNIFIVTFVCYDGCEIPAQFVRKGDKATEPSPAPAREGYSFDGWYQDNHDYDIFTNWDFNMPVPQNMALFARWHANEKFAGIEDISFENYPIVDGSTSAVPLNRIVACKLLGISYEWGHPYGFFRTERTIIPNPDQIPEKYGNFFQERINNSQTHNAFMNLIDGNADIILTHRTISPDERDHADAAGVTLIETPIASDAFIFVVNKNNPVRTLTTEQVRKIYTGEIINWSQVGGYNAALHVWTRPRNSGSEEVFRTLVMKDLEPLDFPEAEEINSMWGVFVEINSSVDAICYTFRAYKELQALSPDSEVPKIAINGIFPDKSAVQSRTYPFISEVHVAIRSDLDHHSMAYKLYEWLKSENAKRTIDECGFVPK